MLSLNEFADFFLNADEAVKASVVEILLSGQQNLSSSGEELGTDDKTR